MSFLEVKESYENLVSNTFSRYSEIEKKIESQIVYY